MRNAVLLVILAAIFGGGAYAYLDSQQREAARVSAQQAAKRAAAAPRVLTAAERQANDEKNQAYLKNLDDDHYRKEISAGILQLNDLASRFNDINQVAAATARIALPQVVQQMQGLRREAAALAPHACLAPAATSLTGAIAEMVNGYLSFMQSRDDTANGATKQHFDNARAYVAQYTQQRDTCVTW